MTEEEKELRLKLSLGLTIEPKRWTAKLYDYYGVLAGKEGEEMDKIEKLIKKLIAEKVGFSVEIIERETTPDGSRLYKFERT